MERSRSDDGSHGFTGRLLDRRFRNEHAHTGIIARRRRKAVMLTAFQIPLLRTFSWQELRHHPWRSAAAVLAVMLGVALAFSVHLINASALDEFSSAVRSVNG